MDRRNAHEGGHRELLGLSNNTPATASIDSTSQDSSLALRKSLTGPPSAISQRYGNEVNHASLAFHVNHMSASNGNGGINTPVKYEGLSSPQPMNPRTEAGSRAQQDNAITSGNVTQTREKAVHNAGRSGIHRSEASEDATQPQRPTATTMHHARGGIGRGGVSQRDAPAVAGAFRGRGRVFDISHARGRGRGGFGDNTHRMAEDISERDEMRNHERSHHLHHHHHHHHRGRGFGDVHRARFGHGAGRGRGHMEYDAEFDRGKTIQDRRADSQKQLFQAPMGYKTEVVTEQADRRVENATRKEETKEPKKQDAQNSKEAHREHVSSKEEDVRKEAPVAGVIDLQDIAATPGLINTGIDVTVTQGDGRRGKHTGERKDKSKRREGRERRAARNLSSDGRPGRERDDTASDAAAFGSPMRHAPFPGGPPAPPHPFERGSPPFPHPPPPPQPHDQFHGRHPPPPDAFFRFPYGPPMPPPGEGWHGPTHGSPPFHHRGPPLPSHLDPREQGSASRRDRSRRPDGVSHALKEQNTRSFRDASSRYSQERDTDSVGSPIPAARQLFDPTKHDPVKFSINKSGSLHSTAKSASGFDTQSVTSSSTRSNLSSLSVASSDYRSRYSNQKDALLDEVESTSSGAGDNALLRDLKASYKEILKIEAKLQDEDSFARTAMEDAAKSSDRSDVEQRMETRPDEYWTKLVQLHREGCEAFHSFIERCMDPMVPASIHSIPQKYNLPGRMWKSAFMLLFERLRSALPDPESRETSSVGTVDSNANGEPSTFGSVLEHIVDFVYYAYTFYTQLLEQQSLQAFRGTWIEHLGDIARYRMSIADISSRVPSVPIEVKSNTSGQSLRNLLEGTDCNATSIGEGQRDVDHDRNPRKQLITRKDRKKGFPGIPAKLPEDLELADTPGNSIGAAALDDWELVEHDIWRTVAQDWYFLGLNETPGTGRLHHRLAMMAQEDELRALYHYSKSVAASHPYAAGSDAIQALFSPEKQAARLQPDASAFSLFVHLHGILYTGSDLDSFDATLARLEEKLEDTYTYAKSQAGRPAKRSVRGKQREDASQRLNRDSTWMMMAVINTCAVMEYGKEGGVLKRALAKAHDQKKSEKQSSRAEKKVLHQNRSDPTPSEASLTDLARQVERLGLEASKARASSSKRPELVPPLVSRTLRLALRFAFSLLRHTIRHPLKPGDIDPAICPYITILFTFLATLASNSAALAVIRSEVPWEEIIQFLESLPKYARDLYLCDKTTIPNRLLGITLPEDWCIRGLEWTGKQLFGRGYWKGKQGTAYMATSQAESLGDGNLGDLHAYSMPESEKDVLAERYEGPSMPAHAGGPQSSGVRTSEGIGLADDLDEDGEPPTDRETVARLRWKRVALTTAWLARAVPFILVDGDSGKVSLDRGLYDDMAEQDAQTAKRTSEATIDSTTPATSAQDNAQSIDSEPDEDGFLMGSGDESETVRELKARRRELKALLRQSRGDRNEETQQAFASRSADDELVKRPNRGKSVNALAGYTTLVFDTNVLLEAMDIFTALLTSKRWTLVVPLAVVTELDGLRSKEDPLGSSASQAIKFLEDAIKTYNLNLKIPTSKGNYLRDLNIRREDIDFGHSTSSGGNSGTTGKNNVGSKDSNSVKSMDDVILNVAIWQKTHWLDRRALLGIKPANTQETRSFTPVETILVSSDRTLRLKGKARGLEVCDAAAIQQLLEQPPNG